MIRLVQKVRYMKAAGAGGYLKYIATREGVELLHSNAPVTNTQKELIQKLLRDHPDTKSSHEYEDYRLTPTAENASALICTAIDSDPQSFLRMEKYMQYIATRPGAEKHEGHGLFGREDPVDLKKAMRDLEQHDGISWTFIYSLRREDAARLHYDNAAAWKILLTAHQPDLAKALNIPVDSLRWYAAFHDAGHHPHIHLLAWSVGPDEGFLTHDGVLAMRSKLTNAIFKDEMTQLYQQKDISYKEITAAAQSAMHTLITNMKTGICDSEEAALKMNALANRLESVSGKKKYGYLPKDAKALVNSVVDVMALQPEVAKYFEEWNLLRDQIESYYKTTPRKRQPLSEQKEFRAVKNIIIQEAELLRRGTITFEDTPLTATSSVGTPPKSEGQVSFADPDRAYQIGKQYLSYPDNAADPSSAIPRIRYAAEHGHASAQYMMGKFYLLGLGVEQDTEQAYTWFSRSAEQGDPYAQYAVDHMDRPEMLPALLSVTRLLHHMAGIFQEQSVPPGDPAGIRMDSKRRREIMQRRGILGQQVDDHELDQSPNMEMR